MSPQCLMCHMGWTRSELRSFCIALAAVPCQVISKQGACAGQVTFAVFLVVVTKIRRIELELELLADPCIVSVAKWFAVAQKSRPPSGLHTQNRLAYTPSPKLAGDRLYPLSFQSDFSLLWRFCISICDECVVEVIYVKVRNWAKSYGAVFPYCRSW